MNDFNFLTYSVHSSLKIKNTPVRFAHPFSSEHFMQQTQRKVFTIWRSCLTLEPTFIENPRFQSAHVSFLTADLKSAEENWFLKMFFFFVCVCVCSNQEMLKHGIENHITYLKTLFHYLTHYISTPKSCGSIESIFFHI